MHKILSAAAFAVLICSPAIAGSDPDTLIVPGERVGGVTKGTDLTALREIYGAARVQPHQVEMGEGYFCHGSRVLLDSGDSLEITWLGQSPRAGAASVRVQGPVWRTKEEIRLGITLKELERLNGKPFRLAGFVWDYGGTVTSWNGGRLEQSLPQASKGRLILRLAPVMGGPNGASRADIKRVMGDGDFSSGHPDMQKLNPRAYELLVIFDRHAQCESFFKG